MVRWNKAEVDILRNNYNKVSNEELCNMLPGKTWLGIYKKAYTMGFRKSKENEFLNRSIVRKGEKGANWKGGTKKTRKGYRLIYMPDHGRADRGGYIMEHIAVFENATGIVVPDGCCVHHLNGIKDDNRIENLCMMTHSAHTVFHHTGVKRSNETRRKISERKRKHE